MSSIADALKRAQMERERLRGPSQAPADAASVNDAAEPSLASVVLRKGLLKDGAQTTISQVLAEQAAVSQVPLTPLTEAIRQAPVVPSPAIRAQQQVAETIVEDYASKRKLNLPHSMVVYHDRAGTVAEQYRKMRDSLMAQNPKREPQTLAVTSAVAGEGKTVTVMNLGLSLVEVRLNRVLLIDGCLHDGAAGTHSLTDLLKMRPEQGLAELLLAPDADVQKFLKATPWHHLWMLPSGSKTTAAAAAELLSSPNLRMLLKQLRANFDWILIDTPPALSMPDAGLVGAAADGIMLAAALHHTPQLQIQTTLRRLKSMNLAVKSCILTRA